MFGQCSDRFRKLQCRKDRLKPKLCTFHGDMIIQHSVFLYLEDMMFHMFLMADLLGPLFAVTGLSISSPDLPSTELVRHLCGSSGGRVRNCGSLVTKNDQAAMPWALHSYQLLDADAVRQDSLLKLQSAVTAAEVLGKGANCLELTASSCSSCSCFCCFCCFCCSCCCCCC